MLKASGLREQAEDELRQLVRETAHHIQELKARKNVGEASEPPIRVRLLRRDLARIKTIMRERGIRENV